jgi:small subunit ribosomal protein S7
MSRRNRPEKREVLPDPRYGNELVAHLINKIMLSGKKSTAERIVYGAMETLEQRAKKPALEALEQAIRNATPIIEVRPRRVGGATYQVPMEIREDRRLALALRWLIQSARKRPGKSMVDRLSGELMDAFNNQGNTVKKREDTHKMAEANRAFAHYRW